MGYMEMVKCLLAAGVDKEKASEWGETPLVQTASTGHIERV